MVKAKKINLNFGGPTNPFYQTQPDLDHLQEEKPKKEEPVTERNSFKIYSRGLTTNTRREEISDYKQSSNNTKDRNVIQIEHQDLSAESTNKKDLSISPDREHLDYHTHQLGREDYGMYFLESKNVTSLEQVELEVEQTNAVLKEESGEDSSSRSKSRHISVARELRIFNM